MFINDVFLMSLKQKHKLLKIKNKKNICIIVIVFVVLECHSKFATTKHEFIPADKICVFLVFLQFFGILFSLQRFLTQ